MSILVTGAAGFTGSFLIRHLLSVGERSIAGIARTGMHPKAQDLPVTIIPCDLTDPALTKEVVCAIRPDRVIHLAGLNSGSQGDLDRINVTGTKNLLNAITGANPLCRVLIVSSSAVYGYAGRNPIGEDTPVQPAGAYGTSKVRQEEVAFAHRKDHNTKIAIVRPFNLVGPGQPDSFVCGRIVKQVVETERGIRRNLELAETRSYRDFVDVRDAVRAYCTLVSIPDFEGTCSGRVFNIASGTAHAVSDVISLVEEITGTTFVVDLPEDPPVIPVPFQQGDISQIRTIGWQPEISLKTSLQDMILAERERKAGKNL
jgi:GDP-4-dehydro-6-deoxy-D-mannose reductase